MRCAYVCVRVLVLCKKTLFLSSSPLSTLSRNLRLNDGRKNLIHREKEKHSFIL